MTQAIVSMEICYFSQMTVFCTEWLIIFKMQLRPYKMTLMSWTAGHLIGRWRIMKISAPF